MKEETSLTMEEYVPLQVKETDFSSNLEDYCEVLPPYSTKTKCNQCNINVSSVVVQTLRRDTWVWPLFFCCCGFVDFCCWVYPIRNWFMEWRHYCGKCGNQLAVYKQPLTRMVKTHLIILLIILTLGLTVYIYIQGKYL